MVKKLTITELYNGVKECRLQPVEESIQQYGIPKSTKKTTDYLVLQTAVDKNHKTTAKLLINASCRINPNDTDKDNGWTPLANAIIRGNLETAMLLLNKGANSEAGNKKGLTVLHLAVRKKSYDMLRLLLCHMSVNLVDSKGMTLLQTFFQVVCNQINVDEIDMANNLKILDLLLKKKASLEFRNDNFGYSPMHYAVKSKQVGLINRMIQETNDVNVKSNTGDTPLHVLLSDQKGYKKGVLDIVKLLVRNGANVNSTNNQNETVLHFILSRCRVNEADIIEIIQFLVQRGADINLQNHRKESACHIAAKKKFLRILHLFLQRQCRINLLDYENNTVLHRLLQNSISYKSDNAYIDLANRILEMGPTLEVRNAESKRPLDLIIQNKQIRILGPMLNENDIDAVDENGNALLHSFLIDLKEKNYKVDEEHVQLVQILAEHGANVDLPNNANKTPVQLVLTLHENVSNDKTRIYNMLLHLLEYSNDLDRIVDEKHRRAILHIVSHIKKPFDEVEDVKASEVVDVCLRRGATIDLRDSTGQTPLCLAVMNKQKHVVRILLEHDADPDVFLPSTQVTVLEYLLRLKEHSEADLEIAGLLLSNGARIDETSGSEFSVLHYVTLPNKFEMCSKLIAHCTDVNIVDDSGNTALHNLILSQMSIDDTTESKVCKIATELILKGDLIDSKNGKGLTPLHLSVRQKLYEVTKNLLQHHANPSIRDIAGNCPLHFLSAKSRAKPDVAEDSLMVQLLIKGGCDVNSCNNLGETPLLTAVQAECISSVKALIRYKADVNLCANEDKNLITPLHVAVERNRVRITENLIKYGADVNAKKLDGKTPLHVAVLHDKNLMIETLLKNNADPNMIDNDEKTPISLATWYSRIDAVRKLLSSGADINIIDNKGKSPMQLAQGIIQLEMYKHIRKINAANMSIIHENLIIIPENDDMYAQFEKEVAKLREVKIDNQKSLADVLRLDQRKLMNFKNNEEFQRLINAEDFHQQYPNYADLIKACYTRGVIRGDIVGQAKIFLRELIQIPLPDVCCDLIFGMLSNGDLQNLVTAARLENALRKRRREEDEEVDDDDYAGPPAKRQRRVSV